MGVVRSQIVVIMISKELEATEYGISSIVAVTLNLLFFWIKLKWFSLGRGWGLNV